MNDNIYNGYLNIYKESVKGDYDLILSVSDKEVIGSLTEIDSELLNAILEANNLPGGQITRLFPEKEIVDIPEFKSIIAKDYVKYLLKNLNESKLIYNENVIDIKPGKLICVSTEKICYSCEKLIIATGLGMSKPRRLGIEGEEKCSNIHYSLREYNFLKDKNIVIFGGGDSALDWAKTLSSISKNVHLVHRRDEFRGNSETISDCKDLTVHKPFIPYFLNIKDSKATSVVIKKVSETENQLLEIPVDYILVNFGNIASIQKFQFATQGEFIIVDKNYSVQENIFVIGDASYYENKTRRIAPGNLEADQVFKQLI